MKSPKIYFRVHAVQRMFERNVPASKVIQTLKSGETIEDYSAEMPEPGRLILGFQGKRPFHIVSSENQETMEITVITVYIPDRDKWTREYKSRKS